MPNHPKISSHWNDEGGHWFFARQSGLPRGYFNDHMITVDVAAWIVVAALTIGLVLWATT